MKKFFRLIDLIAPLYYTVVEIGSTKSGLIGALNMMYCEKCGISLETNCCPTCGSKSLRSPQPDDMCFLAEKDILWSEMLEDVLKQNNVPVLTKKTLGIGMALKVGPMSERVRVYVPYAHLQESRVIVESLFSASKGGECD